MPKQPKTEKRKGAGNIPLGADQVNIFNQQAQSILGQRNDLISTLQVQRKQILGDFDIARTSIKRARQSGLSDVESASIERGVLGSSGDYKDRVAVRANSAAQLADAISARNQALLANKAQVLAANRDAEMGALNLRSAQAAAQSTAFANELLVNGLMTPDTGGMGFGGGGGGGGGGGATPKAKARLEKQNDVIANLARMVAMAAPSERATYLRRLEARWKLRNKLRAKFGAAPLSRGRMDQLIAKFQDKLDTPGGLI